MPSYKSIQLFVFINTILLTSASLDYALFTSLYNNYIYLFLSTYIKNATMSSTIELLNDDKPHIISRHTSQTTFSFDTLKNITIVSSVEVLSFYIALQYLLQSSQSFSSDLLYFIPQSFLFEVLFDFFHYTTHRYCHINPWLYKHIHSHHHSNTAITTHTTFVQHPIDLLLTNTLPIVLSLLIMPTPITKYTFFLLMWYKSFLEIGGHLGKDIKASSFPQCIWLPRVLGIELHSADHNNHHSKPKSNFAKRFKLWDKVFGTYQNGVSNNL